MQNQVKSAPTSLAEPFLDLRAVDRLIPMYRAQAITAENVINLAIALQQTLAALRYTRTALWKEIAYFHQLRQIPRAQRIADEAEDFARAVLGQVRDEGL